MSRGQGFPGKELSEKDKHDLGELRVLMEVITVREIAEAGWTLRLSTTARTSGRDRGRGGAARPDRPRRAGHGIPSDAVGPTRSARTWVETARSLRAKSRIYGRRVLAERDELVPLLAEARRDAEGSEKVMNRHVRGVWAE
jgi:hypothetical protein